MVTIWRVSRPRIFLSAFEPYCLYPYLTKKCCCKKPDPSEFIIYSGIYKRYKNSYKKNVWVLTSSSKTAKWLVDPRNDIWKIHLWSNVLKILGSKALLWSVTILREFFLVGEKYFQFLQTLFSSYLAKVGNSTLTKPSLFFSFIIY